MANISRQRHAERKKELTASEYVDQLGERVGFLASKIDLKFSILSGKMGKLVCEQIPT